MPDAEFSAGVAYLIVIPVQDTMGRNECQTNRDHVALHLHAKLLNVSLISFRWLPHIPQAPVDTKNKR